MQEEREDGLLARAGLPDAFRYLAQACPRDTWSERQLHASASHWLEIHAWFRARLAELDVLGQGWRAGGVEASAFQRAVMPRLRQFLGHLEGHHQIESQAYFPAMAAQEPAMAKGFELLDRDHHAVHSLLADLAHAANGFNQALAAGRDPAAPGEALAQAMAAVSIPIGRHLSDEEEIVIPLLTLRGDPLL